MLLSEFSESLGEMGSCLAQIAPHNDQESGKLLKIQLSWKFVCLFPCGNIVSSAGGILLMLGKVQFELQKLVDTYVSCMLQPCTFHEAICIIINKTKEFIVSLFLSFSVLKYSRPLHDLQSHFSVTLELLRYALALVFWSQRLYKKPEKFTVRAGVRTEVNKKHNFNKDCW